MLQKVEAACLLVFTRRKNARHVLRSLRSMVQASSVKRALAVESESWLALPSFFRMRNSNPKDLRCSEEPSMALLRTGPVVLRRQRLLPPQPPDTSVHAPGGHVASRARRVSHTLAYMKRGEDFFSINKTVTCSDRRRGAKRKGTCITIRQPVEQRALKDVAARSDYSAAKHESNSLLQEAKPLPK